MIFTPLPESPLESLYMTVNFLFKLETLLPNQRSITEYMHAADFLLTTDDERVGTEFLQVIETALRKRNLT